MKTKDRESGAIFVEASVVFPVVFLVILLMIYAGNAYFQKCRVEAVVNRLAVEGAAYCGDPTILKAEGKIPTDPASVEVYPYRALDPSGTGDIVGTIENRVYEEIEGLNDGYFAGMRPDIKSATAVYDYGFLYSTFQVTAEYEIVFPIRMLGQSENVSVTMSSHASMPVSDTTELIRNVNMVEDYLEQLGVKEEIQKLKDKISGAIAKAKEWMS